MRHRSLSILCLLIILFSIVSVFLVPPAPVYAASDLYWVHTLGGSGTGSWSNTSCWSATSGGAGGAGVPNSTVNVHFDNMSFNAVGQIVTVDATANCLSMDWTGASNTPTLAMGTNTINIYGNCTFIAVMAQTSSAGGTLDIKGVSTITTNGLSLTSGVTVGGATVTIQLADALTTSRDFTFTGASTSPTFQTNNNTMNVRTFQITGSGAGTKTLTLGNSTINIASNVAVGWDYAGSNLTLTANTAIINIAGAGNFNGGGITTYNTVNLNGTAHTVSGNNTFVNFYRNGTATKTDTLTLTSGSTQTVTGECGLKGNSATNRLLVQSSTLGSAATIDLSAGGKCKTATTTQNVDFMDITMSNGAANERDLSAITGLSGDCGGNTGITLTTSATQTSGTTDTWSTAGKWTSRVPLPQDDVNCSHNSTVDMPRIGRSITFSGTPTISLSNDINNYGSYTLVSGMTYTHNSWYNYFRGRDSYTLTSNGKSLYSVNISAPTGTYQVQDDFTCNTSGALSISSGTFDANNKNITAGRFLVNGSSTRTVTMGSGTWTANRATATDKWDASTTTGLTFNANTSTIVITNSSTNAENFYGGGLAYNNVTVQGAGNYALTISGNNTFNTFTVDRSVAAKTLTLTAGSNTTVTNMVCNKSDARYLTINSTAGTAYLTKAGGGQLGFTNLNLSNNTGNPVNTWYYSPESVIGANVVNWILDAPPTVTTDGASPIGMTTASTNGTITSLNFGGNANITGVDWGTVTGVYVRTQNTTGDFGIGTFYENLTGLIQGELYYFRMYAYNDDGRGDGVESTFLTKPVEPNTFTTTTLNSTAITCNWNKGLGALNTVVRYKLGGYPTDTTDGTLGYNGTLATYQQSGLVTDNVYFFRAWSWASEGTRQQYSDLYAGNYTVTSGIPTLTTIAASSVEETTATTTGIITYSYANYTVWGTQYGLSSGYGGWANNTGISTTVPYPFNDNLAVLSQGSLYYFRAYAVNIVGTGYGAQRTFLTKPVEPTVLIVTNSAHSASLTWTKGAGALNTVIKAKIDGYPSTVADGTLVYNGTAASCSFTPPLSTKTYYYRAWSWASNSTWNVYSDSYADSSSQGLMSDFVKMIVSVVFMAVMIMAMLFLLTATPLATNAFGMILSLISFAFMTFIGIAIINALL